MTPRRKLRIAMLTHSTNPRGGVAHAMELANALNSLGQDAVLFAPGAKPFFRQSRGKSVVVPVTSASGGLREQIRRRIDDYVAWFSRPGMEKFDIYHAQDGVSGNALADLTAAGVIPGYVRTVHHLDDFGDELLAQWDLRSIQAAHQALCVSSLWRDALRQRHGVHGRIVGNGVDRERFTPRPDGRENDVRQMLGLKGGPVFLSVGGIETRKNALGALKGFLEMQRLHPSAQLVIAGGASLLDHSAYQTAFQATLEASGATTGPGGSVILAGTIADDAMPALYRTADALAFPSLKEGFGLAALEAMASGVPTIVSRIAPFTEYLDEGECLWVDPNDPTSIARAMAQALEPETRKRLIAAGLTAAGRFPWSAVAQHCLEAYRNLNSGERKRGRFPGASCFLAAAGGPDGGRLARLSLSAGKNMCFFNDISGRRQAQAGWKPTVRVAFGDTPPENLILLWENSPMPEMRFHVRWPDGHKAVCYSPSLVIKDYFHPGGAYPLDEFVTKAREALGIASERVRAKYGFACTAAMSQLETIEQTARTFAGTPHAMVIVEAFEE